MCNRNGEDAGFADARAQPPAGASTSDSLVGYRRPWKSVRGLWEEEQTKISYVPLNVVNPIFLDLLSDMAGEMGGSIDKTPPHRQNDMSLLSALFALWFG
jgi:hypothetical protein